MVVVDVDVWWSAVIMNCGWHFLVCMVVGDVATVGDDFEEGCWRRMG